MNIIIDENIPLLNNVLHSTGRVITASGREINRELLMNKETDAIISRSLTKINADLLDGTAIKFVGTSTSGIDHVDTKYLKANKIQFAYAPGSNANSVAEYVVYAILMWAKVNDISLKGKNIGIVGYGNIGKIVADYANALGLNVLVNDPPLKDDNFIFPDNVAYRSIDELCAESDIITNHVPLTKSGKYATAGLFSASLINTIENDSLFIHTSRGYVVDEKSLLERLTMRELTAVIDVWENEPFVNPAIVKYCFMATPHIAGYSYDGKLKGALMMAEAVENYFGVTTHKDILLEELDRGVEKVEANSSYESIRESLESNRALRHDYVDFLQTMLIDDKTARALAFDRLRKQYPRRRESITI